MSSVFITNQMISDFLAKVCVAFPDDYDTICEIQAQLDELAYSYYPHELRAWKADSEE